MVFILTFLMLKIIPTFEQMFQEFGLQLPAVTQVMIRCQSWICELRVHLSAGHGTAHLRWRSGDVLLSGRLVPRVARSSVASSRPIDNASVLQMLSVAVQEKRPLVGSLEMLAAYAPFSLRTGRLHGAIRPGRRMERTGAMPCSAPGL